MAKLRLRPAGRPAIVLALAAALAVLNAKGIAHFRPLGFFDGPH